jgi:GNAT superfamily N-acetyltransferase
MWTRKTPRTVPGADRAGELTGPARRAGRHRVITRTHTVGRSAYYQGFVAEERLADPAAEERRRGMYAGGLADPQFTILCAELGAEVAGFVILGPPPEPVPDPAVTGQLLQIHVRPERWRRGVGSALHRASVEAWRIASVTTARVDVWARNERAGPSTPATAGGLTATAGKTQPASITCG